jgi:YD repeat-containing protein
MKCNDRRAHTRMRHSFACIALILMSFFAAIGGRAGTETYGYDALGRLRTVTSASGVTTTYGLDAVGNRTTVTSGGSSGPLPAPGAPNDWLEADCSWAATWSSVTGAASYLVRDTTGHDQTVTTTLAHVACPQGNSSANKPKWVKACTAVNGTGCGFQANFP